MENLKDYIDINGVEFWYWNGKERMVEEDALAVLLKEGVVFPNQRQYAWEGKVDGTTTVLFVNTSDIFAWACSDAENLLLDDIEPLYKLWRASGFWGVVKWACVKRQEKPQKPVADDMKKAGKWDDEMEALPDNVTDARVSGIFRQAAGLTGESE